MLYDTTSSLLGLQRAVRFDLIRLERQSRRQFRRDVRLTGDAPEAMNRVNSSINADKSQPSTWLRRIETVILNGHLERVLLDPREIQLGSIERDLLPIIDL